MAQSLFGIIKSTTMPLFYKIGHSILAVAQFFYKLVKIGEAQEFVRQSEAGQTMQAAIQARFAAQNSVMLSKFEDIINEEQDKLPQLIKMATRMQFIKYKKDFYCSLQERNMDSFEHLTNVYSAKIVELTSNGKSLISTDSLQKLLVDV